MPIEPLASSWVFPPVDTADDGGLVGIGADLEPATLLAGYRHGLFPMPLSRRGAIGWWSPDPRGVLPLDGLQVSRSLRQSCKRYDVRVDTAFEAVLRSCGDPLRPHGWIDDRIRRAYVRLHELGWAHSVECWDERDHLVGGLYGVSIGGFFAGESMFHQARDASKVALVALVEMLRTDGASLLDVQWCTPHLASLGAVEIDRSEYLRRLRSALASPSHQLWSATLRWADRPDFSSR